MKPKKTESFWMKFFRYFREALWLFGGIILLIIAIIIPFVKNPKGVQIENPIAFSFLMLIMAVLCFFIYRFTRR